MEDGPFTLHDMFTKLSSDNTISTSDFSEFLSDGFWLETTNHPSNFLTPSSLASQPLLLDTINAGHSLPTTNREETDQDKILFAQMDDFSPTRRENSETSPRRLWIGPNINPNPTLSVKKRLVQAIEHLKDSTRDKDVLIQIWVPVKRGGKHVLITNNQPYFLNPNFQSLVEYRYVSQTYQFAAEKDSKELVGLPGRVFLKKLPEWTPDVRFFKREEYPRVNHAHQYNVRGSIAVPVFETGSGTCLGVVEIVTTTQKTHYHPELEDVCKALEAVNLRSSGISNPAKIKDCNESYLAALAEIQYILTCVCDTHKLPLAQTWAPCIQQGKGGCLQSDENFPSCVTTVDEACYVRDPQVLPFHYACSEHHLLKGEGVAGGAFNTNQPCFATDITAFSKTEYPLSHHARMFGLCSAVAIRLRSIYTGSADFVLEFFLPLDCKNTEDQKQMLSSLSSVIQQSCRSLRVVTDQELQEEKELLQREKVSLSAGESHEEISRKPVSPPYRDQDASSWLSQMMDVQRKGKGAAVSQEENFKVTANHWRESIHASTYSEPNQIQDNFGPKGGSGGSLDFSSGTGSHSSGAKRTGERRRSKTEKSISLQVLRQYFAGSLKDAAKSIGVCPTTLKRICRQHGITRWPSRKIKKVGHSLQKLQLVIDSVHGAEGAIKLSSFYTNFPELTSPNNPGTSNLSASKNHDHMQQVNTQPDGSTLSPDTATSKSTSSSGSHNSSSSLFCSTGSKHLFPVTNVFSTGNATMEEHPGGMLKRAHTEAESHDMGQEETKLLVRSQSQKVQSNHISLEPLCPLPTSSNQVIRDSATFKVKATFGKEKIRFSLQSHWGFIDVQQEVLRRFNIEDGKIDLKYLDDDDEWVLLTCDADLEECIDIHRLCKRRTIKISLHHAYHPNLGSSFGSSGPA
ncbi:PREDICTED: protein NLP2 [Nicotiana attenuata]|uniref:Protein nlp2 n=1 Tax=Nicotiana attenuata TaxID=49451 RepID=A0A314L0F8_NICAT|nr:PREDICTED: protein NLP2 [Nicotiana attenuata]XP_019266406.1 PREDICTED: protein NLP2 [Nicotiana attenuata]OIT35080.1 protein nlp2 [Nicotiana attenuata]